jgi:hypothetical protein
MRNLLAMFLPIVAFSISGISAAEINPKAEQRKDVVMQVQAAYPIVVTNKLAQCRDFYTHQFGFQVIFEASWFVSRMETVASGWLCRP